MAKREWQQTTAHITKCKWHLIDQENQPAAGEYAVEFSYEVDGRIYRGKFRTDTKFEVGDTLGVGYDPKRPSINDRSLSGWTRTFLCIGAIILVASVLWLWSSLN